MSWLYPSLLWLLVPIVLLGVRYRHHIDILVHALVAALLVVALARPVVVDNETARSIEAHELILALDVSYSMRAQDLSPDRYRFAKETFKALLRTDRNAIVTLYAFTTNPLQLSPPTTDRPLVETALDAIDPEQILTKGTSLKRLFERLASEDSRERWLIVATDGGEEKEITPLIDTLRRARIVPIVLAVASRSGALVPDREGKPLRDAQDNLVVSRRNPLLDTLVRETEGILVEPKNTPQATAQAIVDLVESHLKKRKIERKSLRYTDLSFLPLLAAAVLFFLLHTRYVRYLLLLATFIGLNAEAGDLDRLHSAYRAYNEGNYTHAVTLLKSIETASFQRTYALANSYYKLGKYDEALRLYRSLRTASIPLKRKVVYNIANCYAKTGRYKEAQRHYIEALRLGAGEDAWHNLSLVLFKRDKAAPRGKTAPSDARNAPAKQSAATDDTDTQSGKRSGGRGGGMTGNGGDTRTKPQASDVTKTPERQNGHATPHPLGSKVYELINKGYIRETKPW